MAWRFRDRSAPEVEVLAKASRRRFTAEYKRQDPPGSGRLYAAGRDRRPAAPGGVVLLALDDLAGAAGAGGTDGPHPEEAGASAQGRRTPWPAKVAALERAVTRADGPGGAGRGPGGAPKKSGGAPGDRPAAERREALMAVITEHQADPGRGPGLPGAWPCPGPPTTGGSSPPATAPAAAAAGSPAPCRRRNGSRSWPSSMTSGLPTCRRPRCTPPSSTRGSTSARSGRCTGSSTSRREVRERRRQLRHPRYAAPELLATRPNQLWSLGHHQAEGAREVDLLSTCT